MKLVTLNIRYGGGKRAGNIAEYLVSAGGDIIVLTEFGNVQHDPARKIMFHLSERGYVNQVYSSSTAWESDAVLIATGKKFETLAIKTGWVETYFPEHDLLLLGIYARWAPENPKDNRKRRKDGIWQSVLAFAENNSSRNSIIIGDMNSNLNMDCEDGSVNNDSDIKKLLDDHKWVDTWNDFNSERDRKSRYTYINMDGRAVRNDYCYASPGLMKKNTVKAVFHDHNSRLPISGPAITDHSALIIEFTEE